MNRPPKRAVDGVLLLDKPPGMTSNGALQRAKRALRAKKAGHTGSLDPLASGLLPLCFGEATKLSSYLLDADKTYEVGCRFGAATDTGDADGEVIRTVDWSVEQQAAVAAAVPRFIGDIQQVPPMYSALKKDGKRLYELARAGTEVERAPRTVTIHDIRVTGWRDHQTLDLVVRCSKGTYIRTLVEDIALAAGTLAHVVALRRTAAGPFDLADGAVTLEQLESADDPDALLLPPDAALAEWPKVVLGDDAAHFIRQGQPVMVPKVAAVGLLRLYGPGERFLGVGFVADDGRVAPKRLIAN